jgi:hypothetical protein
MHRSQKGMGELEIAFILDGESELVSHAGKPTLLRARGKRGDHLVRKFDRQLRVGFQERKHGLGKSRKIPLRDGRLFTIGLTPQFIDRAKVVAGLYESMKAHGPKSMVSPESAALSVFITPWMNPTCIQRDQQSLALHDALKQGSGRSLSVSSLGEVTTD